MLLQEDAGRWNALRAPAPWHDTPVDRESSRSRRRPCFGEPHTLSAVEPRRSDQVLEQHEGPSATRLHTFAIWAEIVAAVAVVVSLVFVGLQIRQGTAETALNTRVAEAAAYQDLQAQLTVITTVQIEHPELRRVLSRVHSGEALDEDDHRLYLAFARLIIRLGDLAYYQRQTQLIDDARLASMLSPLRVEVLSNSLGRSIWESMAGSLVQGFVDYVDKTLLAEPPSDER
jgi:hypothetical protein